MFYVLVKMVCGRLVFVCVFFKEFIEFHLKCVSVLCISHAEGKHVESTCLFL